MKRIFELDELPIIVKDLLVPKVKPGTILTLKGPLGAGKTTMVKELLSQLGVEDEVTSPTFAYVNTYYNKSIFHHFDLYRLTSERDFVDMGFDEYLRQDGATSLIEWPEIIQDLLRRENLGVINVELRYLEGDLDRREIEII